MKTAIVFGSLVMFVASVAPGCSTTPVFHQADAGAEAIGGRNSAGDEGGLAGKATAGRGGAATGAGGAGARAGTGSGADSGDGGEAGASVGCGSDSDPKNCGSCGHDCTTLTNVAPGATVECQNGLCHVPASACVPGFGHCSSKPDDGCEANLSDPDNCGKCSVQCSGAAALCSAADGASQCSATCKGAAADVCASSCVSLKSDPRNCGTCGHDCTALPNVSPNASGIECRASVCYIPPSACSAGFGHCSTRADDGCEVELKTPTNCGACGKACTAPTALCSTTASTVGCSSSCTSPSPDLCGVKCVDVKSDASNCGTCGHDCLSLPNVKAGATGVECRSGVCYVPSTACSSGHAHCSALADDGCEADLSSPQHCGTCTLSCSGSTPLCSTQTQPAKCLPSCTGSAPDVCGTGCVSLATDPKNCGSCGHSCSALPNVKSGAIAPAVQCVAGACVLQPAACVSGFGHCGSDSNSGCETDLTQPKTCGSCSNACTAPTGLCSTTNGAVCSSSCVSPNPDLCTSKCVNKSNDPGNCGTCGRDCASLPKLKSGASVSCSSGGCSLATGSAQCSSGYGNCVASSNDTDGCETQLNTNSNCGACGNVCGSGKFCSSGSCIAVATVPTIVSVTPANNATGVLANTPVKITFSEAMDTTSVEKALAVSTVAASGLAFSWASASTVLTVTPTAGWPYATGTSSSLAALKYTVTVSTAAKDAQGTALGVTYSSAFSTRRRITQTFASDLVGSFSTYGQAVGDGPLMCTSATDITYLEIWSGIASAGTYYNFIPFDVSALGASGGSNTIEDATFRGTQTTVEGAFYSAHQVSAAKVSYRAIDKTVLDAPVTADLGMFCQSANTLQPSTSVLASFKADFDAGNKKHLFRLAPTLGSADSTVAHFACGGFTLVVTQLVQ